MASSKKAFANSAANQNNNHTACQENYYVFDLDQTLLDTRILYPVMVENAVRFLIEDHGIDPQEAEEVVMYSLQYEGGYFRDTFYDRYGISKQQTIKAVNDVSNMDFTQISAHPDLEQFLKDLDGKKVIYTNASQGFAEAVLDAMGLAHHFDRVVGCDTLHCVRKPEKDSFDMFVSLTGCVAERTTLFEDKPENLKAAYDLGWKTVLVTEHADLEVQNAVNGPLSECPAYIDHVVDTLSDYAPETTKVPAPTPIPSPVIKKNTLSIAA